MAIWATKCDCCGERFCFLAVFKYPELEGHQFSSAKLVLHSQQPVGRGTLQFAHDFTSSTGIPVHSVPTGAGLDGATPHVQGYIEFNCQLRLNAAKRLISQRAHLEVRRGSQQQAIAYCEKQETRLEGP